MVNNQKKKNLTHITPDYFEDAWVSLDPKKRGCLDETEFTRHMKELGWRVMKMPFS